MFTAPTRSCAMIRRKNRFGPSRNKLRGNDRLRPNKRLAKCYTLFDIAENLIACFHRQFVAVR
jgi:hypothetical protein